MGLVDDEERRPGRGRPGQHVGVGQLLGSEEQELQVTGDEVVERLATVGRADLGVGLGRIDAVGLQASDLVALEGDEGETTTVGPGMIKAASW